MQYTEKELAKLIEDVEQEFTAHLAKAEQEFKLAKSDESAAAEAPSLVKAEEKKPEEKKEEPKAEEKKEEKPADEAPAAEAPKADAKEEKEAPKAEDNKEAPKAEEAKAPEAPAEESDEHGYDDEDMDHMHQMYSSMSRGELKAHHDAVRKALDAKGMAAQQAEAPAPEMTKSETEVSFEVKSEETQLLKSEIAAKEAKIEELKKTLDGVSEILTRLTKRSAPAGKAITSLDVIAKSESDEKEVKTFTKSEITGILSKKAADPTLTKSDRDAINAYYGMGQVSIEKISHLLK